MIKNSGHVKQKHFLACERVIKIIDQKPHAIRGIKIPPSEIANDKHLLFKNVSIVGLMLAFFVKVFH